MISGSYLYKEGGSGRFVARRTGRVHQRLSRQRSSIRVANLPAQPSYASAVPNSGNHKGNSLPGQGSILKVNWPAFAQVTRECS